MRFIDADALKKHYAWWKGGTRVMTMDEAKCDFDTIIDLQPTVEAVLLAEYRSMEQTVYKLTQALADAEPIKHGRWKIGEGAVMCSECGKMYVSNIHYQTPLMHYCPNCGARMDEPTPEAAEIINDGTYDAGQEDYDG
jgi:hypothetical protein